MSIRATKLLRAAWNNPEALKKIVLDEHPTWNAVLQDIEYLKVGLSGLPLHDLIEEYVEEFNRSIVLAAAQRLRGLGHRQTVEFSIKKRIVRACFFSALLRKFNKEIIHAALRRDCTVACWLLSLRSRYRTTSYSIRIGQSLLNLANRKNVKSAREELRRFELRTIEMAEPQRRRRSRNPVVVPRLDEFSHAILKDTGLELQGEETLPVFIRLERRHVRMLFAAWLVGLDPKCEENEILNTAVCLSFSRERLECLIGATASRTNISQIRKAVDFNGIELLRGIPPTLVVFVQLGFSQIRNSKVITRGELERLAAIYQVEWRAGSHS